MIQLQQLCGEIGGATAYLTAISRTGRTALDSRVRRGQLKVQQLRDEVISEWLHFWLQFATGCGRPQQVAAAITHSI
jgi:hypothetical protein